MKVQNWPTVGFILAMVLVALLILSMRYYEIDLPVLHFFGIGTGPEPARLHVKGEFVESNLGLAQDASGVFTERMLAQQYVFVPQCVVVPAGVPVHFRITSADVVHWLSFTGTDYAIKAMPGVVTEGTLTFPEAGTYPMPCREFCGPGHFAMRSHLQAVAQDQFAALRPGERRTCETQ
jgi:cytochrome c oxidase subunit 2